MKSLQYLSTKSLLENLPLNDETQKAIDEYVLQYLKDHPRAVEDYLNDNDMYNVFFREQDPYTKKSDDLSSTDIHLLKTFATMREAQKWILENGKLITEEEEYDYGRPVVLTIIPFDNKGNYDMDEIPTNMHLIATKKYMTYAFSEDDYNMLLNEHIYLINYDWIDEIIPKWLRYIKDDGSIVYGCTPKDFEKILNSFSYLDDDVEKKAQLRKDFQKFQKSII
jgi:hypothetical protein